MALLQEQVASLQLDGETARHAAIAERAELDEALRARQEELEAARLQAVEHRQQAEHLRERLRERGEGDGQRRAGDEQQLEQLRGLYEAAMREKARVEEEAWAERQSLHAERRQLEGRLHDVSGRLAAAQEEVRRLTALRQEGILSRLFSSPSDRDARRPSIQAQLVHAPAPVMAGRRGSSMGSYEGNGEGRRARTRLACCSVQAAITGTGDG